MAKSTILGSKIARYYCIILLIKLYLISGGSRGGSWSSMEPPFSHCKPIGYSRLAATAARARSASDWQSAYHPLVSPEALYHMTL